MSKRTIMLDPSAFQYDQRASLELRVLFELQPLTPRFGSDYFSLTWKDFRQQHALDFFIAINTAIG
jgi:hypothetical protein